MKSFGPYSRDLDDYLYKVNPVELLCIAARELEVGMIVCNRSLNCAIGTMILDCLQMFDIQIS